MKLSQLRYFQAVCRHNNITRAAEEMHIAQPSITKAIQELEAEFGVSLFYRTKKRLSLTKEGDKCLRQVNRILEETENLARLMQELGNETVGVKIGVPPMIGTFLFPSIFSGFKQIYPDINLEIYENGAIDNLKLLDENALDLAIGIISGDIESAYHSTVISNQNILYCVNVNHPFAAYKTIDIPTIGNEPLVMFKSGFNINSIVNQRFNEAGIQPNVVLSSGQLYTVRNFVAQGIATSFMLDEIVNQSDDIVGIPFANNASMRIGLIWKKNIYMHNSATKFIGFVQKYLQYPTNSTPSL